MCRRLAVPIVRTVAIKYINLLQNHERTKKNPKCCPHWEVNPGSSDFKVLNATPQSIPLCAGSFSPLDSYVVMLSCSIESLA